VDISLIEVFSCDALAFQNKISTVSHRRRLSSNGFDLGGSLTSINGGAFSTVGGAILMNRVTLDGNLSAIGGGIMIFHGSVSLNNATLSGNAAQRGGGISQTYGDLIAVHTTIFQNSATDPGYAGGIDIYSDNNQPTNYAVWNTIIANNRNGNCSRQLASNQFNLSSDSTCVNDAGRFNVTISLGPLYTNGGLVPTHLPFASSPAVDSATLVYCPGADARGVTRPKGAACDVGAVERVVGEKGPALFLPLLRR
jgi:hypothetical protein